VAGQDSHLTVVPTAGGIDDPSIPHFDSCTTDGESLPEWLVALDALPRSETRRVAFALDVYWGMRNTSQQGRAV